MVYHGPGKRALEEQVSPRPSRSGDAIVSLTASTIRGTDLRTNRPQEV